jgi:hypothetical protein
MKHLYSNMGGMYKNFDGGKNYFSDNYTLPNYRNPSGGSTTPTKAKVDYVQIGTTLLNFGTQVYASAQARKDAEAQARVLIAQGASQVEVQKLINEGKRLDLETAKAGVVGGKSGSTVLYVAVGVGAVVILGVVIFAVTRKKA